MADKKKKSYGFNIDFNQYGLRPAGSYLDDLKKMSTDFNTDFHEKSVESENELKTSMDEADSAAKKLLKEMESQNSLAPDSPKTEAEKSRERPDVNELLEELDSLTGLESIKKNVRSLINLAKVRKLREEQNLPIPAMSLHLVFMGNPGTGKTTVARLISQLYYAIGVLSKGQLIEVDRSGLVAGYVGQTAIKTDEAIKNALGGVLFVDEAYSLTSKDGANDFGHEAVETILKAMEDNRDDLVVIVAGYEKPMENFLTSNPGLQSRFNRYFVFEDYNADELYEIFRSMCEKNSYILEDGAESFLKNYFNEVYESRDENFGNARFVRNVFENSVSSQADRVAEIENPTVEDLKLLIRDDVEKASLM